MAAAEVGRALAKRGIGVVYGGGRLGLMGAVADAALEAGGEVIGIIPEALVGAEVAHKGCTELHVVSGMHERKARFTDLSDGFITIPGGVGTMDELWEAISWSQLGYHSKPVGVLNIAGFYRPPIPIHPNQRHLRFLPPTPARSGICSNPVPPYGSGMKTPRSPRSAILSKTLRSKWAFSSHSLIYGATSPAQNSRTVFCKAKCSSVSSNSITVLNCPHC